MPGKIDKTVRENLAQVGVATLTTCLLKRGFRSRLVAGAFPINTDAASMVGPAFTLRFIPAREDIDTLQAYGDDGHVQRRAMEECPPGHVLIIDAGGSVAAASAGDIMVGRLKARGVAGVVSDGGFRDTPDIAELSFPVFHTAPAPPSSPIALHPADLNLPVGCGGVAVYPGDIVVGDREGVVVIPATLAGEIASESIEMTEYETFASAKVAEGRSIFGLYPAREAALTEFHAWKKRGQDR